jgi:hypothetical protein
MADAPVGRTPKEAEEGKLSTFIGGDPETVKLIRPVIECYADTIIEAGKRVRLRDSAEVARPFNVANDKPGGARLGAFAPGRRIFCLVDISSHPFDVTSKTVQVGGHAC